MSVVGSNLVDGSANRSIAITTTYDAQSPHSFLWQSVLLAQVQDLFQIKAWENASGERVCLKSKECVDAENWVGRYPSQNFNLVCTFAGFDPVAVHDRLARIVALPTAKRAEITFRSIGQNSDHLWSKIETFEAALKNHPLGVC